MKKLEKGSKQYLSVRRTFGYDLEWHEEVLKEFVRFLNRKRAPYITAKLALEFARLPKDTTLAYHARRLSIIRRFASYWKVIDPRTEVPHPGLLPFQPERANPHIFTEAEVSKILETCRVPVARRGRMCQYTYPTLFGLIAVTGMRISEALKLTDDCVDLDKGILTIRRTKFKKSRQLPLHESTVKVLREYIPQRNKIFPSRKDENFFLSAKGNRLVKGTMETEFRRTMIKIGLRKKKDKYGPRIHDMRHSLAVNTMIRWYREGLDVEKRLPILSTYLGHVNPSNTYWYLSSVPELMVLAAQRLEKKMGRLS
jgi:integrase/recombinase XerD